MKTINFETFSICILFFLQTLCSNRVQLDENSLTGKYIDKTQNLSIELEQNKNILLGYHCFVALRGSRIDCCLKEDGPSIHLKRTDNNTFEGTMHSCYDDKERKVKLVETKNILTLIFVEGSHLFVSDTLHFYPNESKSK